MRGSEGGVEIVKRWTSQYEEGVRGCALLCRGLAGWVSVYV